MDLKHWKLEIDADNLAWLWFDRAGTATNTFSTEVLEELGRVADHLAAMPPKGLAILSAKENGFAAGADIDEFTTIASAEQAIAFTTLGNVVFDKIAALPFPTLAMIHGFCMGGGTELALACRYRIADDGPKTSMALPEVLIGIVPGWGGAKRMPTLIGAANALDLMLTGRGVDGRRAKRLGLVDVVDAEAPFRQRGAHVPRQAAGAAQAVARRRRHRLARRALARGLDVAEEGGGEGAPGPLPGALRDHRPVEGLRRGRAQRSPRAPGVDGEPLRAFDDAKPHPPLQAAGPHEGPGQVRRARPSATCT